jgi:hypothetical protein
LVDQQRPAGVEQALLLKLEQQVLPQTLELKRRVDAGEKLGARDIAFLDSVLEGLRRDGPYVQDNSQWEALYSRLVALYNEITHKALENEQPGQDRGLIAPSPPGSLARCAPINPSAPLPPWVARGGALGRSLGVGWGVETWEAEKLKTWHASRPDPAPNTHTAPRRRR